MLCKQFLKAYHLYRNQRIYLKNYFLIVRKPWTNTKSFQNSVKEHSPQSTKSREESILNSTPWRESRSNPSQKSKLPTVSTKSESSPQLIIPTSWVTWTLSMMKSLLPSVWWQSSLKEATSVYTLRNTRRLKNLSKNPAFGMQLFNASKGWKAFTRSTFSTGTSSRQTSLSIKNIPFSS